MDSDFFTVYYVSVRYAEERRLHKESSVSNCSKTSTQPQQQHQEEEKKTLIPTELKGAVPGTLLPDNEVRYTYTIHTCIYLSLSPISHCYSILKHCLLIH